MDSRFRGNDKRKKRKRMDSRFRGNDKEEKRKRRKMDSRFRGNDKEKKTEKEEKWISAFAGMTKKKKKKKKKKHGQDAHATESHSRGGCATWLLHNRLVLR